MFQYRAVLVRLRLGDSERDVARARLMGRRKVAAFRALAAQHGWLAVDAPLPEDGEVAAVVGQARRARSTISTAEPFRELVERWAEQGVNGVAIHAALCREHGYSGSYSAVRRLLQAISTARRPQATARLTFAPGEAAQVDFGAGPILFDVDRGEQRRTWCFVMTLCFSRHQYVEFVWDQAVATWLGCHRRAFEWFGAVPVRLIIDNPKCAITKACARDPLVQRAYAECAECYGFKIDPCPPADRAKKGVVEAGVKYVKGNFLPTRSFRDLADLNVQARRWAMEQAGRRVHGTTGEQPLALFDVEKPLLRAFSSAKPYKSGAGLHRVGAMAYMPDSVAGITIVRLVNVMWQGLRSDLLSAEQAWRGNRKCRFGPGQRARAKAAAGSARPAADTPGGRSAGAGEAANHCEHARAVKWLRVEELTRRT